MLKASRGTFWIVFAAVVATVAKLYCAFTTYGSEDVLLYYRYGKIIDLVDLARVMEVRNFNLTPLAAEYSATLVGLLAGNERWFPPLLKLPGILSYLGTVVAMIWLQRRIPSIPTFALVLFAASPVSFMIDGFHGNIDSVMVFPLVLAACACAHPRPSWIFCALFLAVASQVKVIALLTAPIFWFYWMHRGRGWHFLFVTGAAVLLGWLPGILANYEVFIKQVVGYGSVWGLWGITHLLRLTGNAAFEQMDWVGLSHAQLVISQILKATIILGVLIVAWRNRKGDASVLLNTIAFCWIFFFSFAPGMGVQYMLWFAPFLLVWNARWYLALTIVISTVLFLYYHTACDTFPWYQTDTPKAVKYASVLLVPWAAFLACTIAFLIKRKSNFAANLASDDDTTLPAPEGCETEMPESAQSAH
jgi:hypothetical protein